MDTILFEVRRSRIHGRGLFSLSHVPSRRKVGELDGERISQREARKRVRGADSIAIVEFGDGTAVDASRGRSQFRYVNHSCTPNTFMRLAHGRVEFYALRPLAPGDELTCDYGVTHHDGKLSCRCGSARCRGRI